MRWILAPLVVLALVVSGCSSGGKKPATSHDSPSVVGTPLTAATVAGRLIAVGGPAGTPDRPLRGTVILYGPGGSIVKAPVGKDGRFRIQLAAGTYKIRGTSPSYDGGKGVCRTAASTTKLDLGKTVIVDVACQEK